MPGTFRPRQGQSDLAGPIRLRRFRKSIRVRRTGYLDRFACVQPLNPTREVIFTVESWPPAKNEALSMLGAGHSHAPRVRTLLEAARRAIGPAFALLQGPIGLEVELTAPSEGEPWDATNYLGGIGDVLEAKSRRGELSHLGDLNGVALYSNDRQIREVHYRQLIGERASYRVRVWELEAPRRDRR
jgi:hypothetical protein